MRYVYKLFLVSFNIVIVRFREGVVLNKNVKPGKGSHVNVGLLKDVAIDKLLTPGLRVTVRMLPDAETKKKFNGKVESLHIPRAETGVYWGYVVRIANTLSEVFSKSPYKEGLASFLSVLIHSTPFLCIILFFNYFQL